ncbi:MAG: DUF5685 family protein [Planctomycetota bacterium]
MFGYLQAGCLGKRYRQLYAHCCQNMWQREGRLSTLFHSYEAVFLYALAADLKLCHHPEDSAPVCCRLYKKCAEKRSEREEQVADFCAAFAVLLAEIKMRDDVADDRSLLAKFVLWWLRRSIHRGHQQFSSIDQGFESRLENILKAHQQVESDGNSGLSEFQSATRDGFAYLFSLLGQKLEVDRATVEKLDAIGGHVGASIIAFDCAMDWQRDLKRGQANPIRSREASQSALLIAQQELSGAGWLCSAMVGPESLTAQILRHRLASLSLKKNSAPVSITLSESNVTSAARRRTRAVLRRGGFCDACDCCGGCDCGGCECGGCDGGGGGCCCGGGGDAAGGCSCCMDLGGRRGCCGGSNSDCGCCCDGCATGSEDDKRSRSNKPQQRGDLQRNEPIEEPQAIGSMIGKSGVALGPLNPSGIVLLEGTEYPAKTQTGLIEANSLVRVVEANAYGLVVRSG